ncbi:hypothetical protein SH668x_002475 [Planctomicrobium sp. SH668]|uniref:hypothetical protein n=1 Tax=Planctomicrobium sp. SH668 TaxID=3448126 RepID=UPI003F5C7000
MSATSIRALKKTGAHRYLDMWAFPGVHPSNIEIVQRLKMGDDRQFGANMDVTGTVMQKDGKSEKWITSHLVGIRTDAWKPLIEEQQRQLEVLQKERLEFLRRKIKPTGALTVSQSDRLHKQMMSDRVMRLHPSQIEGRRLVMKLFRSTEKLRWVGSIEEMTTTEVHKSLSARKPLLSMSASLDGRSFLSEVQENHKWNRIPAMYSFCYYDPGKDRLWYVNIKRMWFSFGVDFVIEADGQRVGEIDGALFGFGYNAHIHVWDAELGKDTQFLDLITMFAMTVSYHGAVRKAIRRRVAATRQGLAAGQIIQKEEMTLLKNPRKAA